VRCPWCNRCCRAPPSGTCRRPRRRGPWEAGRTSCSQTHAVRGRCACRQVTWCVKRGWEAFHVVWVRRQPVLRIRKPIFSHKMGKRGESKSAHLSTRSRTQATSRVRVSHMAALLTRLAAGGALSTAAGVGVYAQYDEGKAVRKGGGCSFVSLFWGSFGLLLLFATHTYTPTTATGSLRARRVQQQHQRRHSMWGGGRVMM
jgi:hypothetical protein